jgi:PilZ domain
MDVRLPMNEADENNRVSRRSRVLKGAKLVHMKSWSLIDCTIKDISLTGAKLICGDQYSVPDEFRFLIPSDNTIQPAKVVWRKNNSLGIIFTGEKTRAPARKL